MRRSIICKEKVLKIVVQGSWWIPTAMRGQEQKEKYRSLTFSPRGGTETLVKATSLSYRSQLASNSETDQNIRKCLFFPHHHTNQPPSKCKGNATGENQGQMLRSGTKGTPEPSKEINMKYHERNVKSPMPLAANSISGNHSNWKCQTHPNCSPDQHELHTISLAGGRHAYLYT